MQFISHFIWFIEINTNKQPWGKDLFLKSREDIAKKESRRKIFRVNQ